MSEFTDNMLARARATIAGYHMLPTDAPLLVMVSGGGDSVALLRLLASGDVAFGLKLHAVHVDHGLRGAESDADAVFVRELCEGLHVPCDVERVDVAGLARDQGLNLEDIGRCERYRLADLHLDRLCDAACVPHDRGRIIVAHTRDDRVETFLMRLAQGAGATGLTSLRPVRGRVVRPFLDVSRDEVRIYLSEIGQSWREDATNEDTDRLRAKIRHELLPLFREINPRFDEALERTLAVLSDEDELLAGMAETFACDFVEHEADEIAFDRKMMATLSRPMSRRTVRAALLAGFPESSRFGFDHVEMLVDGMERDGFAHELPDGLRAHDEYGRMVVSRTGEGPAALAPCLLPVPGICDLGSSGRLIAEETSADDMTGTPESVVVDLSDGAKQLTVDRPRQGDRMRPLGMKGTKKLSDLLVDAKVPQRERVAVPVVRHGVDVVWLAGVRMSEPYKITPLTKRAIRLTWEPVVASIGRSAGTAK